MDPDFWHELWAQGKIGFHQHDFNDHMQAFTGETVGQRAADAVGESCAKNKNRISHCIYLLPSLM